MNAAASWLTGIPSFRDVQGLPIKSAATAGAVPTAGWPVRLVVDAPSLATILERSAVALDVLHRP